MPAYYAGVTDWTWGNPLSLYVWVEERSKQVLWESVIFRPSPADPLSSLQWNVSVYVQFYGSDETKFMKGSSEDSLLVPPDRSCGLQLKVQPACNEGARGIRTPTSLHPCQCSPLAASDQKPESPLMCPHKPASGASEQDEGEKFIGWAVVSASSMAPSDLHPAPPPCSPLPYYTRVGLCDQ